MEPSVVLVPERVTAFTLPPVKLPIFTSYGAMTTDTCSMASSEMGCEREREPGVPVGTDAVD